MMSYCNELQTRLSFECLLGSVSDKETPRLFTIGGSIGYALTSDVQLGQRVAFMGIVEKQKGHSLVVGTAGASRFRALI